MDDQLREYRLRQAQRFGEPIHIDAPSQEALQRQMEEDEALARRLAEEDEAEAREAERRHLEDERYARMLAEEENAAPAEPPSVPSRPAASFNSGSITPPTRPAPSTSSASLPPASGTDPTHTNPADLDYALARQLQLEEEEQLRGGGRVREGADEDSLHGMPGAFPSRPEGPSHLDTESAGAGGASMASVLGYLFGRGHVEQAQAQAQVPRRPQSAGRSFTFGYDSNRGFYSSSEPLGGVGMGPDDDT
ncbi:hypothetical protein HDV00_000840, partial [Rhizophlyctis rosea]